MFATYTATKAAVDSFAWSLNTELANTPIAVQTIHPGATQTGFFEKCGVPAGAFDTSKFADPSHVARQVLRDVKSSLDLSCTYGSFNEWAMLFAGWALPLATCTVKTYGAVPGFLLTSLARRFATGSVSGLFPTASAEVPANAVVTGGAGGLGRAFVETLAAEGNCKIVSCDVQKGEPLPASMPQQLLRNTAINLQPDGLTERIQQAAVLPEGESIDLLVLNAAVNHARPSTQAQHIDLPDEAIVQTAEVNLVAPLVLVSTNIYVIPFPPKKKTEKKRHAHTRTRALSAIIFKTMCSRVRLRGTRTDVWYSSAIPPRESAALSLTFVLTFALK